MNYKTSLWRRCQLYWIAPMYKLEKSDWEKVDVKKAESWDREREREREREKKKKKPIKALKLKQKEMAFEVKSAQLQRTVEREREMK